PSHFLLDDGDVRRDTCRCRLAVFCFRLGLAHVALQLAELRQAPGDICLHCLQLLHQSDEPTNDLDVATLRCLEDAIENFAGSVLLISHDRWFLDRVATHILAYEGDSKVTWFQGSYTEYEEDRRKRSGGGDPTRVKFRKLATA
ncbi:ABC transporter domain-containing protein, partial [Haematococcus lacustris]